MTESDAAGAAPIRRVVLVAKIGPEGGARVANELGEWLTRRGLTVLFERDTARALEDLPDGVVCDGLPDDVDLVIVAGGDGTLLSVARMAAPLGLPIIGVNLGSLGFLTELQPEELMSGLQAVLDGAYDIEERQTLRVQHVRRGHVLSEHALLNDAVISKSALARMVNIDLRIDDEEVTRYTSDGLIVSTPTGSTAYSLSAGGPILDPRMRAFVIAPICPHSMTYRPLVVPGTVRVEAALRSAGEEVYLTLDGQLGFPMGANDSLIIDDHPSPARFVRVADRTFFEVLRRKLRWGTR